MSYLPCWLGCVLTLWIVSFITSCTTSNTYICHTTAFHLGNKEAKEALYPWSILGVFDVRKISGESKKHRDTILIIVPAPLGIEPRYSDSNKLRTKEINTSYHQQTRGGAKPNVQH